MRKTFNKIDKPLLVLTIICIIFGLLMVGSASSLKSYMKYGESFHYVRHQLMFVIAGLIIAFTIIKIPIKKYKGWIYLGILGVLGALVYVLAKGQTSNGVNGWIFIGGFGIQPSEFAKTIIIVYLALSYESLIKIRDASVMAQFLPLLFPIMVATLVFVQPDFGTMAIIIFITGAIFLIAPYEKKTKAFIIILLLAGLLLFTCGLLISGKGLTESQKDRLNYKEPCTRYRKTNGYQVCNGYIAINSAPILPTNFGNSKQKYLYLPEAHTDFIFAIIMEEMGLVVGIVMMLFYFLIIWRILLIGRRSYNIQGTIIAYGVATYISLHVLINLGGVMGLIPLTGVPLPFYSYGGSFMLNLLACLGLVQRVSVENKEFEQKHIVR